MCWSHTKVSPSPHPELACSSAQGSIWRRCPGFRWGEWHPFSSLTVGEFKVLSFFFAKFVLFTEYLSTNLPILQNYKFIEIFFGSLEARSFRPGTWDRGRKKSGILARGSWVGAPPHLPSHRTLPLPGCARCLATHRNLPGPFPSLVFCLLAVPRGWGLSSPPRRSLPGGPVSGPTARILFEPPVAS